LIGDAEIVVSRLLQLRRRPPLQHTSNEWIVFCPFDVVSDLHRQVGGGHATVQAQASRAPVPRRG